MHFKTVFFIFIISMALLQSFCEAGNAASKKAAEALKKAGGKVPVIPVVAVSHGKTHNITINTNPPSISYKSGPNSPKGKKK
ncbi:hypothetical protein DOY81_000459, partial [Sarcophaga bullata]